MNGASTKAPACAECCDTGVVPVLSCICGSRGAYGREAMYCTCPEFVPCECRERPAPTDFNEMEAA